MEKTYQPQEIEQRWYPQWEKAGDFQPAGPGMPYCIMLPPPNVTGSLHMGHGFQHTLMDALIRYHRMCGDNTLWQGGVDHAGIATQIVVERQLEQTKTTREQLGREAFTHRVWEWKQQSGDIINQQMRRMGSSIDWPRARFTMDEGLSHAVQQAFIQLYQDGLIYRGKRLVNWDPKLQSAVSDLEVVVQQEAGHLWHIRYPLVNRKDYLIVATTRPETLFGDVAVAVHPDDERYKHFIGQKIKLPLTDREIPIIADEYVDPAFGTGCVKITPGHDFNDYAVGQRHQLPMINILTKEAKLNEHTPFAGADITHARKQTLAQLTDQDLLEKTEPYTLTVSRCERTNEIIQPFLTDQWYVNMQPLAKAAIKAAEKGEPQFMPDNWQKTYLQWLTNIQDWCISRQLWWGHRIPAWYDDINNKYYVGENENDIRKKNNLSSNIHLRQDEDVLDTWFSSALWPFATLGWPAKTADLATFYPTSVLVTGFDIIFFWVARMVMLGLHFTGKVPFRQVYITGLIRDHQGQKMSKSKGNVLDPLDLIDGITLDNLIQKRTQGLMNPNMAKTITHVTQQQFPEGIPAFGTDALRFTFCALANTGRDIRFDLGRIGGYRNFCNKLWNAARFVLMQTENQTIQHDPQKYGLAEQWILSRLQKIIASTHQHFADYRFDLLAQGLYEFVWYDYCDWYLELAKTTLNDENKDESEKATTRYVLLDVLETSLRLIHPLMPFITEEIWQRVSPLLNRQAKTIQKQPYPKINTQWQNTDAETQVQWLQDVVTAIRNIRSEMQVSPAKKIPVEYFTRDHQKENHYMEKFETWIKSLARVETIKSLKVSNESGKSATAVIGDLQVFIPLAGLIDIDSEIIRLNKEITKFESDLQKCQAKLNNEAYMNKAPADVVEKDRARASECEAALEKLRGQLAGLKSS